MRNTLTKWMGVRIVVFDNDRIPDIYGQGVKIQPGTETNIGLVINKVTNLPSPYRTNCTHDWPSEEMKKKYSWQPYSYEVCQEATQQLSFLEHCGCFVTTGMLNGLIDRNPLDLVWCTPKEKFCIESVEEGMANGTLKPKIECRPRCKERDYEVGSRKKT